MDRVLSFGEMSDQLWSPPPSAGPDGSPKMKRIPSHWVFELLFHEPSVVAAPDSLPQSSSVPGGTNDFVEIMDNDFVYSAANDETNGTYTPSFNVAAEVSGLDIPVDFEEYQAFLKSELDLACATVALSRAPFLKSEDSSARAHSGLQASDSSQLVSHAPSKDANEALGIPSSTIMQKKTDVPVNPTTSGSLRELSEDDENDGETKLTESMDPADAKRVRRMLSNRESARRSRRRKQAQLTELETQVSQLRFENSSLLKRLTDISQNCNEAAVDNRVLKAKIETLKAKVNMGEETVKRITELNPMFHAMPEASTMTLPSFDGSPSETSTDAAVLLQEDPKRHFYQPPNNPVFTHDPRVNDGMADIASVENVQPHSGTAMLAGNQIGRTASLQRVASLEHLQKRIRAGVTPCSPLVQ